MPVKYYYRMRLNNTANRARRMTFKAAHGEPFGFYFRGESGGMLGYWYQEALEIVNSWNATSSKPPAYVFWIKPH